jgi:hypothetical protein
MNKRTTATPAPSQRRYDTDWLRVLATLLLFYIHPAGAFKAVPILR